MRSLLWAARAISLFIIALPFAIIAGVFSKGSKSTPQEFAALLQRLADGTEGEMDWDVLESVPFRDARLEAIRHEAIQIPFQDHAKLALLAAKVARLPPFPGPKAPRP